MGAGKVCDCCWQGSSVACACPCSWPSGSSSAISTYRHRLTFLIVFLPSSPVGLPKTLAFCRARHRLQLPHPVCVSIEQALSSNLSFSSVAAAMQVRSQMVVTVSGFPCQPIKRVQWRASSTSHAPCTVRLRHLGVQKGQLVSVTGCLARVIAQMSVEWDVAPFIQPSNNSHAQTRGKNSLKHRCFEMAALNLGRVRETKGYKSLPADTKRMLSEYAHAKGYGIPLLEAETES